MREFDDQRFNWYIHYYFAKKKKIRIFPSSPASKQSGNTIQGKAIIYNTIQGKTRQQLS